MDSTGPPEGKTFMAVAKGKRGSLVVKVVVVLFAIWAISWLFPGTASKYMPSSAPASATLPNESTNFLNVAEPHEAAPSPSTAAPSPPTAAPLHQFTNEHAPTSSSAEVKSNPSPSSKPTSSASKQVASASTSASTSSASEPPHTLGVQPDTRNVAAIIETRALDSLAPLMLHFSSVLGPHWPIHIFTNTTEHLKSAAIQRGIDQKNIKVHILPSNITFDNRDAVSEFLTQPWFYEQLAPAGHVLLFQTDSIICANAPMHVDDFLQYDFTGAPISAVMTTAAGYNGGLSLRNRAKMLEIVTTLSWKDEQEAAADENNHDVRYEMRYEDQWFYQKMIDWKNNSDGSPFARLPTLEEAKKFSVETEWYDTPIGYHQMGRWAIWKDHPERQPLAQKYCPEWALATKEEVADE
ncbi:hypothetical protein BJ875DRAFT_542324 [Amylocarpus encephaloides]|uniref:DUF5672 domain-containing protein n=1 Tax=Amylocarpus encephaloides TaxID=45428 RepID=A0A9P7YKB1_9HELO|nr:hypothetical protein BJ875DRAFT_542324 [Amylocarpus encephaloides]